jgi:predicted TIM-barrel fold metal-dependent hydrolase
MKRREFLKDAMLASGLLGMGWLPDLPDGEFQDEAALVPASKKDGYRIDAYCHFSMMSIIEYLEEKSGIKPHVFRSLFGNTPTLIDVNQRLAMMDETGIDLSVLVPLPWIETAPPVHADPNLCSEAARIFNDGLANIVAGQPDRFMGVALLPTTNPDIMLAELERAVRDLKMVGGFFVVGPTVKPPDHPDYEQLYQKAVELDVPLWVHPSRPGNYPDYVGEPGSQWQIWQALSWLLDSSQAMVRLVFSGVFDRYPNLKLIIHHHGALIPMFAQRMQNGWDYFEQNTGVKQPTSISSPYINHFKNFYCDTATQGHEPLMIQMALNFFGPDRILFGSDGPMDKENGRIFTNDAIKSVEDLKLQKDVQEKIFSGNALRLLKRS